MREIVLVAILTFASVAGRASDGRDEMVGGSTFTAFLTEWEGAQSRFINGDPTSWKQNTSHGEDVSIFGAFGGSERGWKEVGPRNDWASAQFKDSGASQKIEYLTTEVSGDLAFTVSIERQVARLSGQKEATPRVLRVTQVFRKEGGVWKLLHRHADPLVERLPPSERR